MPFSSFAENRLYSNGMERARLSMAWRPNGGSAPLNVTIPGGVATVARAAQGRFVVTFAKGTLGPIIPSDTGYVDGSSRRLVGIGADFSHSNGSAPVTMYKARVGALGLQADGTWTAQVRTIDEAGAPVDVTADNSCWVTFWMELEER